MRTPPATGIASALSGVALACLLSMPSLGATDYALLMPGAERSMLLDIAAAGEALVVVGERGHILRSTDGGNSWTQVAVPTSQMLTRVFFISPQKGWAVGHDGNVLFSRDGGASWELQRDGVSAQSEINEARAGRAKARAAELVDRIDLAPDEQKEALKEALEEAGWAVENALEALDAPVYAPPLMDVWFADENHGWASGAYGVLLRTTNGGRQWEDYSHKVGNEDELHLNGVVGAPDGQLFLASEWGGVFRSRTAGETWELLETGYDGSFFGLAVSPVTGTVFAYGLLGTVYRSVDGGDSWEEVDSAARASLFGSHAGADGSIIFVGQGSTAVRSVDDGESFAPLGSPGRLGFFGIAPAGDGFVAAGDGGTHALPQRAARSPVGAARGNGDSGEEAGQ